MSGVAEQLHGGFKIDTHGMSWGGCVSGVGGRARWKRKVGREKEIEGQTRFPLDALATENVPLLGK